MNHNKILQSQTEIPWWEQRQSELPQTPEELPVTKPWWEQVEEAKFVEHLRHIDALDLSGRATIPNPASVEWNKYKVTGEVRQGQEPPKNKMLSYEDIANEGKGWKLHLNFDAGNPATVQKVDTFLGLLQDHRAITQFKIGNGGGKKADAPGKEATVYVGHRDKAAIVAQMLEEGISDSLIAPEGDTLHDEINFSSRVMGRFEITDVDPDFHQYVAKGHPTLIEDVINIMIMRGQHRPADEVASAYRENIHRAERLLQERYGNFYTGSDNS